MPRELATRWALATLLACSCGEDAARGGAHDGASDAPVTDAPSLDLGPDSAPDIVAVDSVVDIGGDLAADSGADVGGEPAADLGAADTASGDGCVPVTDDPAGISDNCQDAMGEADPSLCPAGYECIPFAGFVAAFTCEIRCADSCECPPPSTCGQRCDKLGCIDACVP